MQLLDNFHESSDGGHVTLGEVFFSAVVHSIEFAYLVCIANAFKKHSKFFSWPCTLEIILTDAHFCESAWEEDVDSFWLITIVIVVSDRFSFLEGDISANGRATEGSILIFRSPHLVAAVGLNALAKVFIWSKFIFSRLAMNASRCIPVSTSTRDVLIPKIMLSCTGCLP